MQVPLLVHGRVVHWIDSKATFGSARLHRCASALPFLAYCQPVLKPSRLLAVEHFLCLLLLREFDKLPRRHLTSYTLVTLGPCLTVVTALSVRAGCSTDGEAHLKLVLSCPEAGQQQLRNREQQDDAHVPGPGAQLNPSGCTACTKRCAGSRLASRAGPGAAR